jgi:hypothetical protein
VAETLAKSAIADQAFEGRGKLSWMIGGDQQTGDAIGDSFSHAADRMRHNRQAVCRSFQVNQTEALHAVAVVDAGHRENVGLGVNLSEFFIGQISEEPHAEIRLSHGGAEISLVPTLTLASDNPIFYAIAELWR